MPTKCSRDLFGFAPVEGREVVAAFDGGAITSDAGALLLGATDRAIVMMKRFAACFHDERRAHLIEHEVVTLVGFAARRRLSISARILPLAVTGFCGESSCRSGSTSGP